MAIEKQKWLVLKADDGWQIIIPDSDIRPHSSEVPNEKRELELAWIDCPCKPKINYLDKIITHNSFEDMKRIDESLSTLEEKLKQ